MFNGLSRHSAEPAERGGSIGVVRVSQESAVDDELIVRAEVYWGRDTNRGISHSLLLGRDPGILSATL